MTFRIGKVLHASVLGFGLFCIWAVPLLPVAWIYNRLAIRAAFGPNRSALGPITVKSIQKPSTVTFSNGVSADVGYLPGVASSAFHLVVSVAGIGLYIYKFRRQIHLLTRPE